MNPTKVPILGWFAIFYLTLSLFLLTLIPFDFQWFANSTHLKWYVGRQDIVQNIFLFFPLGVVLQHTFRQSFFVIVIYGTLLSTIIELIQLSDIGRTSNYCDIISNALGAIIGAVCYRYIVSLKEQNTIDIYLVFMLMPLCWFVAMRSATQELTAWIVMPLAITGLTVFKSNLNDNRLKWMSLLIWLIFALIPLIYISRKEVTLSLFQLSLTPGIITLITAPIIVSQSSIFEKIDYRLCLGLLFLATASIVVVNLVWYLSKNAPIAWTVPAHLHWIDTLMSVLFIVFAWAWRKTNTINHDTKLDAT